VREGQRPVYFIGRNDRLPSFAAAITYIAQAAQFAQFFGGAFIAGLALGRFLKSSGGNEFVTQHFLHLANLDSIRGAFPPGIEAPSLLVDFADWLNGRPWGSVGCFSLQGQFSDQAPIFDGSPLRDRFSP
jgi:hypothetical protein